MDYQKVIQTIERKKRFGSQPGVVVSKELLAAAGSPQKDLAFVHIAGTNGKGSAAAFLCSILREAGIKTGQFTSPHLVDFTERIQVDGRQIPREKAAEIGEKLLNLKINAGPTMFDYCLAMALLFFKEQECRIVVLETGLGGRLDATNVIEPPLVGIITKIGYDHMEVLGNTLGEIAAEKAGIFKRGMRAVLESQQPEALEVLLASCKKLEIPCNVLRKEEIVTTPEGFSYPGEGLYKMRMIGEFQKENALAAALCARELTDLGYPVPDGAVRRGIETAVWPGRMEIIKDMPFLLIDGAHNEDGVNALAESLIHMYPKEKFHFIMGVMADKDYRKMAARILPLAEKVTAVTPESGRALQAETLAEYIRKSGVSADAKDDLKEVFRPFLAADAEIGECGLTVAFGSLYFIGEIRKLFCIEMSS